MKKYAVLMLMIPIILAVVMYTLIKKEWVMFGVVSISSIAFLYVFISIARKKMQSDVPLFDVFFGAGFILMMIELRTIIEDDITYFMVFCASIMMAVPVFILLWEFFPVKNKNAVDIYKDEEDIK